MNNFGGKFCELSEKLVSECKKTGRIRSHRTKISVSFGYEIIFLFNIFSILIIYRIYDENR
jgi:accessory gene regulator protein AgrB